jgi:hypothetical protein
MITWFFLFTLERHSNLPSLWICGVASFAHLDFQTRVYRLRNFFIFLIYDHLHFQRVYLGD